MESNDIIERLKATAKIEERQDGTVPYTVAILDPLIEQAITEITRLRSALPPFDPIDRLREMFGIETRDPHEVFEQLDSYDNQNLRTISRQYEELERLRLHKAEVTAVPSPPLCRDRGPL